MQTYDLIQKTRRLIPLTEAEIRFLVEGFTAGEIPDEMMAAWLMAVCCQGLTEAETTALTLTMRDSGDCLDLSAIGAPTVDKHSTGGIGDKTTLICTPIAAACGAHVAKMSGRGLGFTGGTIDKLESIPGFSVTMPQEQFLAQVRDIGCAVISQSGHICPADKKMYALRDRTATVDSIPLICASILSKKLALGADGILLDVKYGSGAFMKTPEQAVLLAETMVRVGTQAGRRVRAVITDMNAPLGNCVGNALEVEEAVQVLRGEAPGALCDLSCALAAQMLTLSGMGDVVACRQMAEEAVASGAALEKLRAMIAAQGGDASVCDDVRRLPQAAEQMTVTADRAGYIAGIVSEEIGLACLGLGAGRASGLDAIDYGAGVRLHCAVGDAVNSGDPLFTVYGSTPARCEAAAARIRAAVSLTDTAPAPIPMIHKIVDA